MARNHPRQEIKWNITFRKIRNKNKKIYKINKHSEIQTISNINQNRIIQNIMFVTISIWKFYV